MLKHRKATNKDLKFINHSSFKGVWAALKDSDFIISHKNYSKQMDALQAYWKASADIDVLFDDEFPDVIISYVVSERKGDVLHLWWCYTKLDLRWNKMMKTLMEYVVSDCTSIVYYFPVRKLHRWYKKTSKDPQVEAFKEKLELSPVFKGISQVAHTK